LRVGDASLNRAGHEQIQMPVPIWPPYLRIRSWRLRAYGCHSAAIGHFSKADLFLDNDPTDSRSNEQETNMSDTPRAWLVTGCSTGIGRALVQALISRGERVFATARNPQQLSDLVGGHDNATVLKLDVTSAEDIKAAAAAVEKAGGVDVLVNNARATAISPPSRKATKPATAPNLRQTCLGSSP
jgi:hypothetical protein